MQETPSGRVKCSGCGNTLGEYVADLFIVHHRRREIVCREIQAVRCDECGRVWRPPQPPAEDGAAGRARLVAAAG